MIKLTPTGNDHVFVEFYDETAYGVTYKGSYHAHLYDGKTWEGTRDSVHKDQKPFDYPLNTWRALSARRQDSNGSNDATSAAKKVLAERCLTAVVAATKTRPQDFVQAQLESLKQSVERATEAANEAAATLEEKRQARIAALKELNDYKKSNGIK